MVSISLLIVLTIVAGRNTVKRFYNLPDLVLLTLYLGKRNYPATVFKWRILNT